MKPLLLIGCFAFLHSASAQEFKVDIPKIMKHSGVFRQLKTAIKPINRDSLIKGFQNFFTTKHGPGMYELPQDNMPCLVPDTENIATMPNAWSPSKVPFKPDMPNPGLKKKPFEKPNEKTK